MQITQSDWDNYVDRLRKLSDVAADKLAKYIETYGIDDVDSLVSYAYALVTKYGEGSAELACQMYDAIAEMEGLFLPSAVPAATATYNETYAAIRGSLMQSETGQLLDGVVKRLVKQASADTMVNNAIRDGAQWAWIPRGDTCAFCITLSSNGWQYASKKMLKGGHASHIHANCDCQFCVRHSTDVEVQGYDPSVYREMYYGASNGSANDKVNAMRRKNYQEHREEILEQKRLAYARRTGKKEA